jgi:hypothetical protein
VLAHVGAVHDGEAMQLKGSQILMHAALYLVGSYPAMRDPLPSLRMPIDEHQNLRRAFNIIDACVTLCEETE